MDSVYAENIPPTMLLFLLMFMLITWTMVSFPNLAINSVSTSFVGMIYTVFLIFTLMIFLTKAAAPSIPLEFTGLGDPEKSLLNVGVGSLVGAIVAVFLLAGTYAKGLFTITEPLQFFFIVLVAPVVEEFFFRGTLLPTLTLYMSKPVGLVLSSVFFALYHTTTWGAGVVVPFMFALLLGFLTIKFESITPAVLAHMTANIVIIMVGVVS